MKTARVLGLLQTLVGFLDEETRDEIIDRVLDVIEDKVVGSENLWDDRFVLPMVRMLRARFDVPDDD